MRVIVVAGRLKEKFNKVGVVISFDEAGTGKGSGRSLAGFSLSVMQCWLAIRKNCLSQVAVMIWRQGLALKKTSWMHFINILKQKHRRISPRRAYRKEHIVGADITVGGINIGLVEL